MKAGFPLAKFDVNQAKADWEYTTAACSQIEQLRKSPRFRPEWLKEELKTLSFPAGDPRKYAQFGD